MLMRPKTNLIKVYMFLGASEFKVRNFFQLTGHFEIYVHCLLGWRYIFSLHSAAESQYTRRTKQLSCVVILLYRFLSCQCLELSFTQHQFFSLLYVIILCQQHFSHALPCSFWFLINNGSYMFQSWTHAVPVNPKLYLLG